MHRGEKVNFLFPSHKAYGYRGDTKKIAPNTPLLITVKLNDFKSEVDYKKEQENQKSGIQVALKNDSNYNTNLTEKTTKTLTKPKDSLEQ